MIKVLIIEDEIPAAEKLELLLHRYDADIEIIDIITSVEKSIEWLKQNENKIDLIFIDIQLTDGISFDIFKAVEVKKPVIFTTAYNEYAIDAFKVNSIDYLLKPIIFEDLCKSIEKFKNFSKNLPSSSQFISPEIIDAISKMQKKYKNRFLIKIGEHIKSLKTENISLFYAEGRTVFVITEKKRKYIVDFKLEELENILDPSEFFRLSRSFIININAITDVIVYSNSRLKIKLAQDIDKDIIVSREKVTKFKNWFSGIE
ncbi:MAG: response regulator transcription factor [Bacteroidales bacterium]|nr:response regulator transcription factor [Bacteroidales bacterium]